MFKLNETNKKDLSIYIHIPFCESRCYYCDFYSSVLDQNIVDKYFISLIKEIDLYKDFLKDKLVVSIFIGGGTPSIVDSKYIIEILNKIRKTTTLSSDCEITIETNPNSITENKLKDYISSGINRYSMGAQSFNNDILKSIGRVHQKSHIINAINLFKKYNINNFSFDLMLSLPYQKKEDVYESINMIQKLNPAHISYYSLIIEPNTIMEKLYKNKNNIFPTEEEDRDMYEYIVKSLKDLGYNQYEISNFAQKGYSSKHNLRYWTLDNYIGLGASSHSNIDNIRYYNHQSFNDYFKNLDNNILPVQNYENLTKKDRINEYMIMGLRTNKGINIDKINKRYSIDVSSYYKKEIEKNIKNGLIEINNNYIQLTKEGFNLSNIVELDFMRI